MEDPRINAFRLLKKPCVELSQLALRFQASKATSREIITALQNLHQTLRDVTRQDFALDGKLAEYTFFPLSHIFRENKVLPVRAVELAIYCLEILIAQGWKNSISPDLAKQLLILLTVLAGGGAADGKSKDINEELAAAAYSCLASLFRVTDTAGLRIHGSVDVANFPVIGHAVSVLLEGAANGPSVKVRLGSLGALDTLISNNSNKEVLKSFFPGVVSALTKVLSGGSRSKGSFKVLQGSLDILDKTILKVVSDDVVLPANPKEPERLEVAISNHGREAVKDSWLEATSAQVKLALANVLPLRYHEKDEVRRALFRLCMTVLERCRRSLHQSIPMILETSVVICTQSSIVDTIELLDNLKIVIANDFDLLETLKSSLHDWIVALPRIMQSSDDIPKKRSVDQISIAFEIIGFQGAVSDILNHAMASNLRSSISTAIQASASKSIQSDVGSNKDLTQLAHLSHFRGSANGFPEVLFTKIAQQTTVQGLQSLTKRINASSISATLQRDIVETLRTTSGDEQLASLWLAIRLLDSKADHRNDISQFIDLSITDPSGPNPLLADIYAFALSALSEPAYSTEADWRLQALCLEALALEAQSQRKDFRPELVDALYPILERMGSPNAALQRHAMTALGIISQACSYPTPRELIIENVDYLVNAVALKLNTFDISPQAPQVMIMMVKLCGASLIPYLDDLVESIFAILECYHGYPKLVEQMFGVLNAIVEEGNRASSASAITDGKHEGPVSRVAVYKPISIADLATELHETRLRKENRDNPAFPDPTFTDTEPTEPNPENKEEEREKEEAPPPPDDTPTPLPTTLSLLHNITLLTQHHLPTSSPSLRLLLLNLLPASFPPLSHHPTHFLPLTHALWPVLLPRLLSDREPPVVIAACRALTALCRAAGDFLLSRFEAEWERVGRVWVEVEIAAKEERRVMGRRGVRGRELEALEELVAAVVRWVGVTAEMEDGVWEMVMGGGGGIGARSAGLREVLLELNPDAFWLVEERGKVARGGTGADRDKPVLEGVIFEDVKL